MNVRSGITSSTPENVFIDAGAIYFDYGLSTERLLGATRGGNEFNTNRISKNMEVDGAKGKIRGMERVTEVNPQITVNMLELSIKNLIKAIAGANQSDRITIGLEHIQGDGAKVEYDLNQNDVVENSEKVFVKGPVDTGGNGEVRTGLMVEQTRSKKYSSRFVGAKAAENKQFETGTGTWATAGSGTLAMKTLGQSGKCLEYTPNADLNADFLKILGADGSVITNLVKDQYYRIQIAVKANDAWDGKTMTVTCGGTDTTLAIADPSTVPDTWVVYVAVFKAGSSAEADIKLTAAATPGAGPTLGLLFIDSVELERVDYPSDDEIKKGQIGYVMKLDGGDKETDGAKASIIFMDTMYATDEIVLNYTYVPSTASDAVDTTITGGEIKDTDYIDNVAIVGNVSGKTYPVICIVKNALAEGPFSLSTAPRDEVVPAIVFTGHYDPDYLDIEPWEIRYPKS